TGPVPGSNAWAIGPSRSASGNAMLLQNPHLPWRIPLMRFTEAHLVGPGVDLYGVTQIGVPVIAIGFNERLGWSHTVNRIDAFDTWRLSLAGDGYRFDGAVRPFEVERQVMRIRDDDGELRADTLVVRRSVHGPVVEMDDSTAVAVRTPLLQRHDWVEPWWRMGRARDLDEFEAASARLGVPMFTTVYADRDGHIYNLFGGQVPVRPSGDFADWQMSAPGDTSATLWTEVHPYEDLPKVVDPPSGFVQNSNSPPWYATVPSPLDPADFPPYMAPPPWVNLREARAIEMLLSDESITFDELIELRYSTRMLLADRLVDDLVDAARSYGGATGRAAADVLEAWDRNADADSRGAVLFAFWAQEVCASGSPPAGGGDGGHRCGVETPWSVDAPFSTPDGLADPERAVAVLERVAGNVRERFGALDVPWGDVMRLSPELRGNGAPGDPYGIFHVVTYAPSGDDAADEPFLPVAGDTWVAAIEFGPDGPRARAILSYGNASRPDSPHHLDQLPLLSRREMREVWLEREEIEANLESRTPIGGEAVTTVEAGTR
ncbi:MAG: penicillin acylase family protein, partial [Gemmatimonadota bacterium]